MKKHLFYLFAILTLLFTSLQPVAANDFPREIEPNNTKETATLLNPEELLYVGALGDNQDQDYFKFELSGKSQLMLLSGLMDEATNKLYAEEYYLELYNLAGDLISKSEFDSLFLMHTLDVTLEKGTYFVAVKSTGNVSAMLEYSLLPIIINQPPVSISFDLKSPQAAGKKITIKGNSDSEYSDYLEYQFSINGKIVKGFSTSKSYSWTPTIVGTYKIKVEARDPGLPELVGSKEVTYVIKKAPDFKIKSFSVSKSPQIAGKEATFKALADKSGLEYQFYVDNKVVKGFGKSNSYKWKTNTIGKYNVKVEVRNPKDSNMIVLSKTLTYEVKSPKVKISQLKSSLSSPRPVSTAIKVSAKADGVDLQYKFSYYHNKKWTTIQKYSSKSTVNWKPKSSGSYKLRVEVLSKASNKKASKTINYKAFKPSKFSITSLSADKKSPEPIKSEIKLTAKAKGSHLEYRFRIYDQGSWYTHQDWSNKAYTSWTPYFKGKYKISVEVRQHGTKTVKTKLLSYEIK